MLAELSATHVIFCFIIQVLSAFFTVSLKLFVAESVYELLFFFGNNANAAD